LSGGTDKARFYWNTGYLDEQGVVVNSSYKRLSSRLKMDMDVKKRLKATSNVSFSYEMQKGLNENTVFQQIAERIPYFPIFEPDGSLTVEIAGRQNPLAEALKSVRDNRNFRVQNFNSVELNIVKGLTFKSTLGVNFRYNTVKMFDPTIVQTPPRPPTASEELELSYDYQQENYFTYKKTFNKIHTFTAIAGTQLQRWNEEGTVLDATSFSSDNIQTFNNVLELNAGGTTSSITRHSLVAAFTDVIYDLKGRYRIKGTLRRDGSSRFGADRRYGYFPSGQIGWRISEEPFLRGVKKLDNLMLRYTYGENGNERIGNYESRLLYRPGSRYNGSNGTANFQLANPGLSWESTVSQNLGVDLTMFRTRLNFSVDLWDKRTKDLLYSVPLPEETGFSTARRNIGSVQNRGIDLSIGGVLVRTRDFEWSADFNITFLRNKVLKLNDADGFESGNFFIQEGQPMGNMYGYRKLGVFPRNESNAFTAEGQQLTPVFGDDGKFVKYTFNGADYAGTVNRLKFGAITLLGGDVWWEDRDRNFNIDAADRSVLGNGLADYFGGTSSDFRYKGFTLSVLFNFNFGNQIFRNYDQQRNDLNSANETPAPERIENAWLRPGDVSEYASLDRNRTQNRLGPNSQYIVDGDFIKWNNIRLSYAAPAKLLKNTKWFSKLAFNVSVNNPLMFTNYTGFNPELGARGNPLQQGQDNLRYPNKREILFGLSVQL
jgi:TonB-dependent starch-binding outer membrane protein SusC